MDKTTEIISDPNEFALQETINGPNYPNTGLGYASNQWAVRHMKWVSRGDTTPHFHKVRKDKRMLLPPNPYVSHKHTVTAVKTDWSYENEFGDTWTCHSPGMAYGVVNDELRLKDDEIQAIFDGAPSNKAMDFSLFVTEALSNLAKRYFDLGTFYAELRKTIRMFQQLLTRFIELVKSYSPDKIIDAWLQIRYGFRPLYYDMLSFMKTMSSWGQEYMIYSERVGRSFNFETVHDYTLFSGAVGMQRKIIGRVSGRGNVYTRFRPSSLRIAPITTAWEVVTFSFIVDWFFSVGDFLTSLEAEMEFPDYMSSGGYKIDYEIKIKSTSLTIPGFSVTQFDCVAESSGYVVKRFPQGPQSMPTFRPNLNILKLTDLLAILIKLIRGRGKQADPKRNTNFDGSAFNYSRT